VHADGANDVLSRKSIGTHRTVAPSNRGAPARSPAAFSSWAREASASMWATGWGARRPETRCAQRAARRILAVRIHGARGGAAGRWRGRTWAASPSVRTCSCLCASMPETNRASIAIVTLSAQTSACFDLPWLIRTGGVAAGERTDHLDAEPHAQRLAPSAFVPAVP